MLLRWCPLLSPLFLSYATTYDILLSGAAVFASSSPNIISRLTGVQGFVVTHHHHHHSRQFRYSARVVCQTYSSSSSHISAERGGGGRGERGGKGRGGRGRGGRGGGRGRSSNRDKRGERRPSSSSSSSTSGGDITTEETEKKEQPPTLGYRERWFQAHPNMNNNNQRRRRGGGRNNNNDRRGRRERTPPPSIIPLPGQPGRHCHNSCISSGMEVYVVKKEDQRSGRETIGKVSRLLTNSKYHPRGIKVMLDGGIVGRVTRFVVDDDGGGGGGGGGDLSAPAATNTTSSDNTNVINYDEERNTDNNRHDRSIMHSINSSDVNDEALATLVGMDFDQEKSRKALQMFDNDVPRAVNYILNEE